MALIRWMPVVKLCNSPDHLTATGQVQMLAIGMVAVYKMHNGLSMNLGRRHDPEHQAGASPEVGHVDEIDGFDGQKGLATTAVSSGRKSGAADRGRSCARGTDV